MQVTDVFRNLPILETERLTLRRLTPTDVRDVYAYASDPEVARYMAWSVHRSPEDTMAFIRWTLDRYAQGQPASWAIELRATRAVIGGIGFTDWWSHDERAEIAYALNRAHWNKGYMTEAVRRVVTFGFRVTGLNRIEAKVSLGNSASERVLAKAGFHLEGTLRQHMLKEGVFHDMRMFSLLRGEHRGA